jgi:hypothetical protein
MHERGEIFVREDQGAADQLADVLGERNLAHATAANPGQSRNITDREELLRRRIDRG